MLYAILIHGSETEFAALPDAEYQALMARHTALRDDLEARGGLGPTLRLAPGSGRTVRRYKDRAFVTDGPFAETKEQLMGIYVIEGDSFDDALAAVERLDFETGVFEIYELANFIPGRLAPEAQTQVRRVPR